MDRVVVGITGASGIPYGIRLLEVLKEFDAEVHLTCSPSASPVSYTHLTLPTICSV